MSRFCTEAASSSAGQGWNGVFLLSCRLATTPALPACISHLPQRAETVPGNPALRRAYKWPWAICGRLGYTLLQPFWNQNGDERPSCGCPGHPQEFVYLKFGQRKAFLSRSCPKGCGSLPTLAQVGLTAPPRDSATPPCGECSFLGSWRDGWRDAPDWAAK